MKAKDLWDNIKYANLCIIGIPEGEEREKGVENVLEKLKKNMAENLPNLKKETYIQVQEAQRIPTKTDRPASRYFIIKMAKVKKRGF